MKENAAIEKLINNFYWRNGVVLFVLLTATITRKIYLSGGFNPYGFYYGCIVFPVLYVFVVFHNTVLYRRLFKAKYYIAYATSTVFIWLIYNEYILPFFKAVFNIEDNMPETFFEKFLLLYGYLVYTYIGLGIYLGFNYFKQREDSLRLAYLQRELELKQLKAQLHPHFLFNALNNIYSYSLEQDKRADELILKLSELMRAITQNSERDIISLDEELQFIDHYISFELERLGDRCAVCFKKNIRTHDISLPPFLLFAFIENAFKHGTASTKKSQIEIELLVTEFSLALKIINPLPKIFKPSTRTGVINSRRRLELLYPNAHLLTLSEEENVFKTDLMIDHS